MSKIVLDEVQDLDFGLSPRNFYRFFEKIIIFGFCFGSVFVFDRNSLINVVFTEKTCVVYAYEHINQL